MSVMSTTLCHIVWGTWAFLAITRCEGNIGYGFTRMSYFRPFLPSNCIELCSGGRFSAHRKHFLALIEVLSTLAAEGFDQVLMIYSLNNFLTDPFIILLR